MTTITVSQGLLGREWRDRFAVLIVFAAGSACAADLRVTTEYIYPTSYEVVGGGGQFQPGPFGNGTVQQRMVAVPRDFATREVGVVFSPGVTLSHLNSESTVISSLEQRNKNGNTELMIAATLGDTELVRRLLARGAMVNAKNNFGSTALMGAAAGGFTDIVALLMARGAMPNSKSSNGSTALMFAARNGQSEVVLQLIGKGAAVNDSTRDGYSPLMFAISSDSEDVVHILLNMGARKDVQDRHGTTPLALASVKKNESMVVLLTRGPATK